MRKTISYLSATLLCLSGCIASQTAPPHHKPKNQIIKKEPKSHTYLDDFFFDPYPFVGSINYAEDGRLIGSAVLIASNMVLTAAHVSEGRDNLMFVEYDGDSHCISEIIYYPSYDFNILQHDIAILVLETESDEIPVELIDPEKYHIWKGMKLTTVGYGTGRKRFSNYGVFWYYGRLMRKPEFMVMLPIEGSIWFGDSGGGVFTLDNKLIGIMSHFQTTVKGKIFENGCASIEYYRDWIEEIKNERTLERMVRE